MLCKKNGGFWTVIIISILAALGVFNKHHETVRKTSLSNHSQFEKMDIELRLS